MNLKDDSQDSRNSDLLHLEDDLSKDLQEIIALEKIKSAPKSRKEGSPSTCMDLLDVFTVILLGPGVSRKTCPGRNSVALIENTLQRMVAILESLLQSWLWLAIHHAGLPHSLCSRTTWNRFTGRRLVWFWQLHCRIYYWCWQRWVVRWIKKV